MEIHSKPRIQSALFRFSQSIDFFHGFLYNKPNFDYERRIELNLRYLEYFCLLAKYQHYSRAAEELGIAQSSLSHAIARLEQELDACLFEKQGRNVVLTHQGTLYLKYAESALHLLEDGKQQLQKISGAIRIGFVSSVRQFLLETIHTFQENSSCQDCQFLLYENATDLLIQNLTKNRLDLVLASSPNDLNGLATTTLLKQRLVVIDSTRRPLIRDSSIRIPELSQLPLIMHTYNSGIRQITEALFSAQGYRPFIAGEASEDNVIIQMVAMGLGTAIVTETNDLSRSDIRVIELDDPKNYRYIYMTMRKGRYRTLLMDSFVKALTSKTGK